MDDEDVHHVDFTTASTLEVFIARIKEVFMDWGLNQIEQSVWKGDYNKGVWSTQSETVVLVDPESVWDDDVELKLTRYALNCESTPSVEIVNEENVNQVQYDLLSFDNDFCKICLPGTTGPHPLARWYGLRDFLVLVPKNERDVNSESKVKTLASCLHIAVNDNEIGLPVFLQSGKPWQLYYVGLCQSQKHQIDFEMVHLEQAPSHCKYLTGLLAMFKSKIGSCLYTEPVTVAVRFTFKKTWPNVENVDRFDPKAVSEMPFGSTYSPFEDLIVSAIWPRLLEQSVVDGKSYSDLEAILAPIWRATVVQSDDPRCSLSDYLFEFLSLIEKDTAPGIVPQRSDGTIPTETLMTLLYYLFPDANDNPTLALNYPDHLLLNASSSKDGEDPVRTIYETRFKDLKSVPYGSLPWRLAIAMAHAVHSLGGSPSAEFLWQEFAQELVYRAENNFPIPGIEPGNPNPRACLLYQKLQLINYCIAKRLEREKRALRPSDDSDSEPDEFYDCFENENEDSEKAKRASWDQPTGRQSKHGDLRLLTTGEPLFVPKTQEPPPRTEDQAEEHAELLIHLGTTAEGAALRASLMSASLLADMAAFKAANPGCIFADFIRWYSPRDWIDDDVEKDKGHLSDRMSIPGNKWEEVWDVAQPVPARCQRRLFDDTKELQKALAFFEQPIAKCATNLLPVLMSRVLLKLDMEADETPLSQVRGALDRLIKRAKNIMRPITVIPKNFEDLTKDITGVEKLLVQFKAIYNQFLLSGHDFEETVLKKFVADLVMDEDVSVPGGASSPYGQVLYQMLTAVDPKKLDQAADKSRTPSSLPDPNEKEIIFRVMTNKGPQRMYAVLKKNEFRLCGAFSNFDTV